MRLLTHGIHRRSEERRPTLKSQESLCNVAQLSRRQFNLRPMVPVEMAESFQEPAGGNDARPKLRRSPASPRQKGISYGDSPRSQEARLGGAPPAGNSASRKPA